MEGNKMEVGRRIKKINGKRICPNCDSELEKRVVAESRKKHGKIKDTKVLKKVLNKYDFYSAIPFVKSLEIDNSNISAKNVAMMIKKHYKL